MLKVRVIPILLLREGRLVKSIQFKNYRNLGNFLQALRVYNSRNVDEMVILDIDKSDGKKKLEYDLIEEISKECFMPLTVGGGIKTLKQAREILKRGADKISLNSGAIWNPKLVTEIAESFGRQAVVVSIDVCKVSGAYRVITQSGEHNTGKNPIKWAQRVERLGAGEILITSIEREGMMKGYDLPLIEAVSRAVHVSVIANGGAGKLDHFAEAMKAGANAVAASSIFQYTQITPQSVRNYLSNCGFATRCDKSGFSSVIS